MAMRRDIADLRTTFSVAGVQDVVAGARAAAAGLDAVGSAASRQAAASAAAGAKAADAARAQATAAAAAAQAQARLLQSAREAAAAARAQYRDVAQAAEEGSRAESAAAAKRADERTADLRRELSDIDARTAARAAASQAARKLLAEASEAEAANRQRQKDLGGEIDRITVERRSSNVRQRVRESMPDATAEQRADAEDALHDELNRRAAEARREISELQARAKQGYGIPKLQNGVTEAENAEHEGNADDAAQRRFAEQRIAAVEARVAAELAAVRAGHEAQVAAAREAAEEAERILERETAASEGAAAAQARAVREAAAAEVLARKEAAAAKARIDADAARDAARADVAAQAASDRQAAGGDTAAAVRMAEQRHEETRRASQDRIRREQAAVDDAAAARKDADAAKDSAEGRTLAGARAQAAALQRRLAQWEKENKGRKETPDKEAERADLEDQADSWRGTARNLQRGQEAARAARRRAEDEARREAAERMRLFQEVEDARVAASGRALDEVRRLLAQETIAAQQAAKAQEDAAKEAAKARAKAAAEAFSEISRVGAAARAAAERVRAGRERESDVAAGMADPDALRARAAAAAADRDAAAGKAAARLSRSQGRADAARGTDRESAVAEREARFARSAEAALASKERAAARYAAALAEVERQLRAVEAEAERALRTSQAEADRAAASIARIGDAARKTQGDFKAASDFKVDLDRGLRTPRQTEALAKAWAAAYERAVARVVAAAAEAEAAIAAASGNPADAARVAATEQAKVDAAQKAADRVREVARRTGDVWKEVARRQVAAARDAARAQEQAAKRTGDAWRDAAERFGRIQRSMPTLFGERTLATRLRTQGSIPVLGGMIGSAGRAVGGLVGGVSGLAGSAVSGVAGVAGGVFNVLSGVVTMAGKAAGSVLSIGAAAVTATGRLALYLGQAAISTLARLGAAAGSTALKLAGLAKTIVVRASFVGAGAMAAGYAAAKKAVGDTADTAKEVFEGSMATRTGGRTFQMISAAAKSAGVDMRDFQQSLTAAKDSIANINSNPTLVAGFTRLNVWTRDAYGRILDTSSVLETLLSRISQLSPQDQWNVLEQVFGSRENVERMMPLIVRMTGDADALQRAWGRQQALGSIITSGDVGRMRQYNAATADLRDAFTGMKLAVARAVGPDIIAGMYRMSNLIAASRFTVAGFARQAFNLAAGLVEVLRTGNKVGDLFSTDTRGGQLSRLILNGAFHLRRFAVEAAGASMTVVALGQEMRRAFVGVWAQHQSPAHVFIAARRPMVQFAEAVYAAQRAVRSTFPFFKELWEATRGDDAHVVRFPWLITVRSGLETVGRFAREVWRTIRGEDGLITEFPVLLRIRSGLETVVRFAGEAWSAITGKTWQVTEFPFLLRMRSAVVSTFQGIREFAREAWEAVTGGAQSQQAQFPFLYAAADAVRGFVAEVKATASDLVSVWNGFDPQTWLGTKLQAVLQLTDQAGKAWADLQKVFDAKPDSQQKFTFPWIRDLAADLKDFAGHVQQAWETFKGFYQFFDRAIQRMSFGKLDLATVAITTGFLTLFGVTRVVFGGLRGLALAAGGLRGLFRSTATAAAGTGAAGLAGALNAAGSAAERSGAAASRSASLWGRLSSSIAGVVTNLARNPGVWALLGIGGGIAGDMLARNADPENGTGRGWAVAGGALQGAGTGLMLGAMTGNPLAAAGGAIAGGLYGAFSSNADYNARRLAAVKKQLQDAGHGDVAAKISETELPAGSTPEGLTADERSSFGEADRAIGQAEESLKQALAPMGADIAAIREASQRGAGLAPGAGPGAADAPLADYGAMGPAVAPAVTAAATAAATKAVSDQATSGERFRAVQQGLRSGMAGIMANDPMRMSAPPVPAAAPMPPGANLPGRQSALGGGGESAMFIVRTQDGVDRQVHGLVADVRAIRDELNRGVAPTTWSTA